jgi:hypothetical protein
MRLEARHQEKTLDEQRWHLFLVKWGKGFLKRGDEKGQQSKLR